MNARRKRSGRDVRFEFQTVLLDVDGTLIGSNAAHAEAWTQALREHGVTVDVGQIRLVSAHVFARHLDEVAADAIADAA